MSGNREPSNLVAFTQSDLVELAKWQGSVGQALTELTSVVQTLNTTSVTKEDMTEFKEAVKESVSKLDESFQRAIDKLPCGDTNKRLTKTERELDRLGVAFKIKSSAWGLLGGLLPATAIVLWLLIKAA
jgi:hypothetical protein